MPQKSSECNLNILFVSEELTVFRNIIFVELTKLSTLTVSLKIVYPIKSIQF